MSDLGGVPVADARPIRVLFVCTGNSERSVMAEALLRHHGAAAFEVHSAGTEPKGINPLTLRTLTDAGIDASWARHWGYEAPAAAEGTEEERLAVFRRVFIQLGERISQFVPLAQGTGTPSRM